jgi:KDO2-lipid IV(A) lauroyltransferase
MHWLDRDDVYYLAVLALIRFAAFFRSPGLSDAVANGVARIASLMPTAKRREVRSRLAACFDHLEEKQIRTIAHGTYRAFWQDAFSLAGVVRPADALRLQVDGLEHVRQALAGGHGAILLDTSFFGRRHLARVILHAHGMAIVQLHASDHLAGFWSKRDTRMRRDVIRPLLEAWERRSVQEILYLSRDAASLAFTRQLVGVLQANRLLCLSGEGRIGQKAVRLPFLGGERRFVTGAMSLAKHSGAALLPFFCWRGDDGRVRMAIEPPIDLRGQTAENGAAAYCRLLETYVRRQPAEYYGWHVES